MNRHVGMTWAEQATWWLTTPRGELDQLRGMVASQVGLPPDVSWAELLRACDDETSKFPAPGGSPVEAPQEGLPGEQPCRTHHQEHASEGSSC